LRVQIALSLERKVQLYFSYAYHLPHKAIECYFFMPEKKQVCALRCFSLERGGAGWVKNNDRGKK
jgi:hypothetical protein